MALKIKRPHLREIREKNRLGILRMLRNSEMVSRPMIADSLGLSKMSVSRLVRDLMSEGICIAIGGENSSKSLGRRPDVIRINPKYGIVVAICLSAFSKTITISDITGATLLKKSIPEDACQRPDDAIIFIDKTVRNFARDQKNSYLKLLGCSVVVAGKFNTKSGILLSAPLLNWPQFELQKRIKACLDCPVVVDNIANALCMNYVDTTVKLSPKSLNIMLVHIAVGMGASLFVNGALVRRGGDEGWVGKTRLHNQSEFIGEETTLSDYVSGHAIIAEIVKRTDFVLDTSKDFASNFRRAISLSNFENSELVKIFTNTGEILGKSLFYLSVGIRPDLLVLGGPIRHSKPFIIGVDKGLEMASKQMGETFNPIKVSNYSYIDAAKNIALREHVYS